MNADGHDKIQCGCHHSERYQQRVDSLRERQEKLVQTTLRSSSGVFEYTCADAGLAPANTTSTESFYQAPSMSRMAVDVTTAGGARRCSPGNMVQRRVQMESIAVRSDRSV